MKEFSIQFNKHLFSAREQAYCLDMVHWATSKRKPNSNCHKEEHLLAYIKEIQQ